MDDKRAGELLNQEENRLQALRSELAGGLRAEDEQDDLAELSSADQHPAEVGTETFNRSRDLSTLEQVDGELEDIKRARERLARGGYGTCEACGEPISDERLEVEPGARYCVEHQRVAEAEARAGFTR